jgi:hypothetical protein
MSSFPWVRNSIFHTQREENAIGFLRRGNKENIWRGKGWEAGENSMIKSVTICNSSQILRAKS